MRKSQKRNKKVPSKGSCSRQTKTSLSCSCLRSSSANYFSAQREKVSSPRLHTRVRRHEQLIRHAKQRRSCSTLCCWRSSAMHTSRTKQWSRQKRTKRMALSRVKSQAQKTDSRSGRKAKKSRMTGRLCKKQANWQASVGSHLMKTPTDMETQSQESQHHSFHSGQSACKASRQVNYRDIRAFYSGNNV